MKHLDKLEIPSLCLSMPLHSWEDSIVLPSQNFQLTVFLSLQKSLNLHKHQLQQWVYFQSVIFMSHQCQVFLFLYGIFNVVYSEASVFHYGISEINNWIIPTQKNSLDFLIDNLPCLVTDFWLISLIFKNSTMGIILDYYYPFLDGIPSPLPKSMNFT